MQRINCNFRDQVAAVRKGLLRAVLITHDYKESVKTGVGPVQQDGEHFGCRKLEWKRE